MKKIHFRIFLPCAALATLALAAYAADEQPAKSHDGAVLRNLTTFNSLVTALEENYVDSIRTDDAFRAAMGAYMSTIDPYTEYYDADDVQAFSARTTGEYGGVGSYIVERNKWTYFSEPFKDSPAAEAGIKAGDRIIAIDGENLTGLSSDEVTKRLKGVPGTEVKIMVVRSTAAPDSVIDFTLTRRKLSMPSVEWAGVVNGNTGYIKLESFMDKSAEEVRQALEEFKANPAVTNLVLDLRGNGGGLVESAVDIVGFFVPKGTEVLRTKGKNGKLERIYKTTKKPIFPDMPLAVLIDGGSASASEITAGAIQDMDRGILVGSRSYGKGLVQSTLSMPYNGLVKVTIAKYYIPSGRLIQAVDYSHRNPDGSVARIPDSLTNVFHTRNGREVRDGGGLKPDFEVDWGTYSPLLINLASDFQIFDYATRYAATHPEIPGPGEFTVTDEIYDDFKASVDTTRLTYEKRSMGIIDALREGAELEGYLTPEVTAALDSLRGMLDHDVYSDMDVPRNRRQIAEYLGEEIVVRYYFNEGKVQFGLRDDPGLDKALEILNDSAAYRKALKK